MRTRVWTLAAALVWIGCAFDPAEDAERHGTARREIVNGTLSTDFPTAGLIAHGETPETSHIGCSGTLVGCTTFVTAGHCFCADGACQDGPPTEPTWIYLQHAGFHRVASVAVHPDFKSSGAIDHDVAVLTLAEPVSGIRPTPVTEDAGKLAVGQPVSLVGFGRIGADSYEYGIKREAEAAFTTCPAADGPARLCWIDEESSTCSGDSGGSYLVAGDSGHELAGIHSGSACAAGLLGGGSNAIAHRAFIEATATESLPAAMCGPLPPVGEVETFVVSRNGFIESGEVEVMIGVPPGTAELRVGLNSTDSSARPDLDLVVSSPEGETADAECASVGESPYAFCRIISPVPGSWRMRVLTMSGPSDYQLVGTALGGGPLGADDAFVAQRGQPLTVGVAEGVLANDESTLGPLAATVAREPEHGTVALAADGSFVYTPEADHVGPDSFEYLASDGTYSTSAIVTFDVAEPPPDGLVGGCGAGGPAGSPALALLVAVLLGRRRPDRKK